MTDTDPDLILQAWRRWWTTRDPAARERLIMHYSPLVKFVAGRLGAGLPDSVDPGDLVGFGVFGLMDAIDRFDEERGTRFSTFAVPRIRGAILDGLRSLDWVPRSVRSRSRAVQDAIARLEMAWGRSPTDDEIASELGVAPEEFQTWLANIAVATVGPLDHVVRSGAHLHSVADLPADDPSPQADLEDRELRHSVRSEVRRLPDRERMVLALYYDEGLTLVEIGQILGVTESRVSQIHARAVLQLRSRLLASGAA